MAQKRYHDFEATIVSYDFARWNLGMHRPGRYAGFDTLVPQSVLSFRLSHAMTGLTTTNPLGASVGPLGVVVSNQGVVVEEDDLIPVLNVDTNVGNDSTRYDYVVMAHTISSTPGGSAATYSIIKGPLNNPTFPTLSNPQTQVIVGFLTLAAGAAIITPTNYTRATTPDNGGEADAKLNSVNVYSRLQQQKRGSDVGPTFDISSTGEKLFTIPTDGNTFRVTGQLNDQVQGLKFSDSTPQEGCKITLILTAGIGIFNNKELSSDASDAGYKSIYIPKSFQDIGGGIESPGTGEEKVIELTFYNDKFLVTYVTSTVGGQTNQRVSASSSDTKPGVLFDKLKQTDYIGLRVTTDTNKGDQVEIYSKGKEQSWDNTWKQITSSLDSNHTFQSGAVPRFKIDYYGKLTLRDFAINRVSSLAHLASGTATVTTLPISLPREVIIPITCKHAQGSFGTWANLHITASGVVIIEYAYHSLAFMSDPQTGFQFFANNITLDITLNPG